MSALLFAGSAGLVTERYAPCQYQSSGCAGGGGSGGYTGAPPVPLAPVPLAPPVLIAPPLLIIAEVALPPCPPFPPAPLAPAPAGLVPLLPWQAATSTAAIAPKASGPAPACFMTAWPHGGAQTRRQPAPA